MYKDNTEYLKRKSTINNLKEALKENQFLTAGKRENLKGLRIYHKEATERFEELRDANNTAKSATIVAGICTVFHVHHIGIPKLAIVATKWKTASDLKQLEKENWEEFWKLIDKEKIIRDNYLTKLNNIIVSINNSKKIVNLENHVDSSSNTHSLLNEGNDIHHLAGEVLAEINLIRNFYNLVKGWDRKSPSLEKIEEYINLTEKSIRGLETKGKKLKNLINSLEEDERRETIRESKRENEERKEEMKRGKINYCRNSIPISGGIVLVAFLLKWYFG